MTRSGGAYRPAKRSDSWTAEHWPLVAIAAALIVIASWLGWRHFSIGNVRNLDSRGTTVIAFGDSLTAGYGAGAGEDYPSRVSAATGMPIVNAGVSGDTTEGALARLDNDVLARNPRIVIVGLGGNDYLQSIPIATTETNLRAIIEKIQGAGAMVVLLGFRFPSLNADYDGMYQRLGRQQQCLFIANLLRGILTDPQLKSDEVHPNAKGYQLMADRVAGPLQRLIRAADSRR